MMDYINSWLDKHYPKKFKLRIRRWSEWDSDMEIVYSYTRFRDKYEKIKSWDETYGWRRLFYASLSEAKAASKEFDTIEKIQAFNNEQHAKFAEWKKEHPSEEIEVI